MVRCVAIAFGLAAAGLCAAAEPRALLDQYCISCHNDRTRIAGVSFEKADASHPAADPELWERVIRKMRAGTMPPAGNPRPAKADANNLIATLTIALDSAAAAHPNPGRYPLHRLNR